jgi:hypothetical protein
MKGDATRSMCGGTQFLFFLVVVVVFVGACGKANPKITNPLGFKSDSNIVTYVNKQGKDMCEWRKHDRT